MNAGQIIYGLLSVNAGVTALVSTRIYPDNVPQNAVFPYIAFQLIQTQPLDTKEGASPLDTLTIQVDCYAQNYDTAQAISTAVRAAIDRYSGTVNGHNVDKILFSGQSSGAPIPELSAYWSSQDYTIRLKR